MRHSTGGCLCCSAPASEALCYGGLRTSAGREREADEGVMWDQGDEDESGAAKAWGGACVVRVGRGRA